MRGIFLAKLFQVLASASIGLSTMLLARLFFGDRAAKVAGVIWCVDLPRIGFAHAFWKETLFLAFFLPGLYQLVRIQGGEDSGINLRITTAAVLVAVALFLKDAPL